MFNTDLLMYFVWKKVLKSFSPEVYLYNLRGWKNKLKINTNKSVSGFQQWIKYKKKYNNYITHLTYNPIVQISYYIIITEK